MRKTTLLFLLTSHCFAAFTQNTFESNTATSFTLNQPCLNVPAGMYSVQLRYFDLNAGDWTTPSQSTYITYSNVQVTNNSGLATYNFSSASPSVSFPTDPSTQLNQTQGTIIVLSNGSTLGRMNWDYYQLNCPALPVTIMNWKGVSATVNGLYQANLSWQTASEDNSSYFLVEKQVGNLWKTVAQVAAAGNSNTVRSYSCVDLYPVQGYNVYRLKEVDLDGSCNIFTLVYVYMAACNTCFRTPPSLPVCNYTIGGQSVICSGASTYGLSSIPGNGTIVWSVSSTTDAGLLVRTCPNTATVTNKSDYGSIVLTAASGNCSNTATKTIYLSNAPYSGYYYSNGNYTNLVNEVTGTNNVVPGSWTVIHLSSDIGTSPQWTPSGGYNYSWSTATGELEVNVQSGGYVAFDMSINGGCSTLNDTYIFSADSYYSYYSLSPNPSNSNVTVFVDDEKLKKFKVDRTSDQVIEKIMIVDKLGNVMMQKICSADTRQVTLNISTLPKDFYIVKIYDGKKWVSLKLMKE